MKNGEYCLHAEQYYWTVPELLFTWTRRPALLDMGSCKPQATLWKFRNYWSETRDVTPMNTVRDTILRLSRHLPAFFPKTLPHPVQIHRQIPGPPPDDSHLVDPALRVRACSRLTEMTETTDRPRLVSKSFIKKYYDSHYIKFCDTYIEH